jgi:hypothetical protein
MLRHSWLAVECTAVARAIAMEVFEDASCGVDECHLDSRRHGVKSE